MLMYPRGQGYLTAKDGQLTMTAPGVELPLAASRPKVYWAVGNCLTGVVNTNRNSFKNSYALAWMKNGAKQYIGAVQSTWYELNWNMADWFLKQEGRCSGIEPQQDQRGSRRARQSRHQRVVRVRRRSDKEVIVSCRELVPAAITGQRSRNRRGFSCHHPRVGVGIRTVVRPVCLRYV
jgi:hypothetical protein